MPSSTDEGFEDARSGDFIKSPPISNDTLINNEKSTKKPSKQGKNVKVYCKKYKKPKKGAFSNK